MDFKVVFRDTFLEDLERIVRGIAVYNPAAANKLGEIIIEKAESLSFFPDKSLEKKGYWARFLARCCQPIARVGVAPKTGMFHTRAAADLVAQISNLLYRRFLTCLRQAVFRRAADWKSAIQQVRNLRYVLSSASPVMVAHHRADHGCEPSGQIPARITHPPSRSALRRGKLRTCRAEVRRRRITLNRILDHDRTPGRAAR